LTPWYFLGQDQNYTTPGIGLPTDFSKAYAPVNAKDKAAKPTVLDGAIEGHVLVKNIRNALPLRQPQLLSVFGYDAAIANQNDPGLFYSYGFESAQSIIYSAAAALGIDLGPAPPLGQTALNGTLLLGGGSGANSPSLISGPLDALQQQAYEDDTSIFYDTSSLAPSVDPTSDACVVFINAFATEGTDRNGLYDEPSDSLVNSVASACNNTIVVIHNAGIRLVDQFADHPNVTAIIFAHLPGQDSGRAIAALLHGQASFSGKLPYTVAKNESDYGPLEKPDLPVAPYALFPQSNFTEGLYIDYRRFDALNITPRYEFGFGLSYTTFSYSDLVVTKIDTANNDPLPSGPIVPGGRADLWDVLASVDAKISNTGSVNGQEVVQLYIGTPAAGTPVRQLRGFVKESIDAGGVASVHFDIMRRDLSVWDVTAQEWRLTPGTYQIYVGASSRDLRLNGTLEFVG
jgi:beta-glucosidase